MYTINNITKSFHQRIVLDHFSLSLPQSGVIVLMGPSGCGKTTLLRLLAGLEKPDDGSAVLAEDTKISMVFQEDRLLDAVNARGNIQAVLPREKQGLADLYLAAVGLEDAGKLFVEEMSGGMSRRLAIARAIAFGGDILLLDEPFKGLDEETKRQVIPPVFEGIPGIPGKPERLTVMVTHSMEEARLVADEIIIAKGTPFQVESRVKNRRERR